MERSEMDLESWLIWSGRPTESGEPLNTPPVLASNFRLPGDRYYTRTEGTPTQNAFESLMGGLEGGRSLAFSSGMAAVACVFHALPVGSVLAIPEDPYHAVNGLAVEGEEQGRWTVRRLDLADARDRGVLRPEPQRHRPVRRRDPRHPHALGDEIAALDPPVDQVHRRVADEARDESVGRMIVDLGRAANLLDDAFFHDDDAVGQGHRLDLVVGHIDGGDGELVAEVLDLRPR